jgi:hypothetical protein
MLENGQCLRLWTAVMSANEGANALAPEQWVAACTPGTVVGHPKFVCSRQNVLAAFRFTVGRPSFDAEDYLNALASSGAIVESIVTLGQTTPDWVQRYGVPYGHVVDVSVPTNRIAEQVRKYWGWR